MPNVAVAWLSKEDWPRWRALDPALVPYDLWLVNTNRLADQAERSGASVVKVALNPDDFVEWCKVHGQSPNERISRSNYSAYLIHPQGGRAN